MAGKSIGAKPYIVPTPVFLMKKLFALLAAFTLLFPAVGIQAEPADDPETLSCTFTVSENPELHSIVLNEASPEAFDRLGFRLGDSCDIRFPDGSVLKDVPFYNGYYCRSGEPLLIAYPGYTHVQIAICNGDASWKHFGCREGDTVTVTLAEAGRYLDVQEALNLVYSNERADFTDDETFANFRALSGGRIRENTFFRGASPVNDTYHRAVYVNRLIRDAGIRFVLDLADNAERIRKLGETSDSAYFLSLNDSGLVVPLDLLFSCLEESYQQSVASGLREMMKHEGPYYIHCLEGKDRTGFICMLLEALAGAGKAELEADYMKTYENYYGILPGSKQYDAIVNVKFLDYYDMLAGLGSLDPETGARTYLMQAGMTEGEIRELVHFLTVNPVCPDI